MKDNRKLAYTVHVTDDDGNPAVYGPDSTDIPDAVRKQITNPSAWADGDGEVVEQEPAPQVPTVPDGGGGQDDGNEPPAEPEAKPYDQLLKDDLTAEVDRRNAGRDDADKVVVKGNGNKPDLVKALKADDKAQADKA